MKAAPERPFSCGTASREFVRIFKRSDAFAAIPGNMKCDMGVGSLPREPQSAGEINQRSARLQIHNIDFICSDRMGGYLTISALIERCAPFNEEQRAAWTRRARHWSMAGQVLPKEPKPRRGSGRHRRYRTEDIYLIAVMFRLSDSMLPIGTLNAISEIIQDWLNDP